MPERSCCQFKRLVMDTFLSFDFDWPLPDSFFGWIRRLFWRVGADCSSLSTRTDPGPVSPGTTPVGRPIRVAPALHVETGVRTLENQDEAGVEGNGRDGRRRCPAERGCRGTTARRGTSNQD
eukprot:scaffold80_cov325-Pavlova_lutheri.AAC.8